MSSFVINKAEFVKAAGLLYGVERAKRFPHRYFYESVRERFVRAYVLNVRSVDWQYGDESSAIDGLEYDGIFAKYAKVGERIAQGLHPTMTLDKLRDRLWNFFNSVLYQIEEPKMNEEVAAFFYTCLTKLNWHLDNVDGWWGDVEI